MLLSTLSFAVALIPAKLPELHQDGRKITDVAGKEVRLRGINLGSWLLEEMWMTPWVEKPADGTPGDVGDSVSLWNQIEKRFGKAETVRVRETWRDNWITAADFARIKAAGFDHVRVPFPYTLLEEPGGLKRLHWAVDTAAQNGLYTVLDLHGAPGRQSNDHPTGERNKNRLWFDVENITKMEEVWTKLGREFGSDSNVAMFDLMNEPMGAPNVAMLHLVYNRVYQAVRKVAPRKLVLIDDGYKGFETTPHPNLAGWTNVVFSLHFYQFDAKSSEEQLAAVKARAPRVNELLGYRSAPLYVGEFQTEPHGNPQVLTSYMRDLTANGWSWAVWTYKTDSKVGPLGQWGLYRRAGSGFKIDPFADSLAAILEKIKTTRTENFESAPGLLEALKTQK